MTSKKPVKKAGSSAAESPATMAKSAAKTPVGKKPVLTQAPSPQPAAIRQPVNPAALCGILNESARQIPSPAPIAPGPVPVTAAPQEVSGKGLYNRIQLRAYLLAEKDGFTADPVHYWVQAERAVKAEIHQTAGT